MPRFSSALLRNVARMFLPHEKARTARLLYPAANGDALFRSGCGWQRADPGSAGGEAGGGARFATNVPREARSATNLQRPRPATTPTAKTSVSSPRPSPNIEVQGPFANHDWRWELAWRRCSSFSGAGASGDWRVDPPTRQTVSRLPATATKRHASVLPTGQHRPSAPRDHLVAKCATATNIKSTGREETAEFRAPSDVPTSKCNRKRRKRKLGVPIGDQPIMAVTISQHVSPVQPTPSTNSRWMRTSTAANIIGFEDQ